MKGRLGCAVVGITIALLWAGGQKTYTGMKNRTPTALTAAEYVATKPPAHWLKLTNCRLFISEAMYKEGRPGVIQELFIPVRPDDAPTGKSQVLLSTKDPELLLCYNQIEKSKSEAEVVGFLKVHAAKLFNREISGLVRYGIDLKDSDRSKLASLGPTLAPDFIILNDGEKPNLGLGLGLLIGGLTLTGVAGIVVLRAQK